MNCQFVGGMGGGVGCHHVDLTKVQNTNKEAKIMFFRISRISTRVVLLL